MHAAAQIGRIKRITGSRRILRTGASGKIRRPRLLAAGCLIVASTASPATSLLRAQPATLIRDALLIDGTGRAPVPHADILIAGGLVSRIAETGAIDAPPGAVVIEASGKTVIPGIINLRGLAGLVRGPEQVPEHFSRQNVLAQLSTYVSYGVTTTTSLARSGSDLEDIREQIDSAETPNAARVLTPLRAICRTIPRAAQGTALAAVFEPVRSTAQARRAVDQLVKEGADFIEFRDSLDQVRSGACDKAAQAVAKRAARHRLRVSVVTSRLDFALTMIRSGARVVASSINDREIGERLISEMLAAKAVYAPALSAESAQFVYEDRPEWIDDRYLRRSLPAGISGQLRGPVQVLQALDPDRALKLHRFDIARQNLRQLAAAGVPIGLASGSGFPHSFEGYSEYREAVLMKHAGLTEVEIIKAFSAGSAAALGIGRERGSIEPGKFADLVILNENPLDNIHNLRDLHAVFVGGALMQL